MSWVKRAEVLRSGVKATHELARVLRDAERGEYDLDHAPTRAALLKKLVTYYGNVAALGHGCRDGYLKTMSGLRLDEPQDFGSLLSDLLSYYTAFQFRRMEVRSWAGRRRGQIRYGSKRRVKSRNFDKHSKRRVSQR